MANRLNLSHPLAKYVSFAVFGGPGVPLDITGNTAPFTTTNGSPTIQPEQYGRAFSFESATNDYYQSTATGAGVASPDRPFTIAWRFNQSSQDSTYDYICSLRMDNYAEPLLLLLSSASQYRPWSIGVRQTGSNSSSMVLNAVDGITNPTDEWIDVAMSFSGAGEGALNSSANWRGYYNGAPSFASTQGLLASNTPISSIATNPDGTAVYEGAIAYIVVLDGIEASSQLARPDQVLGLLEPTTQTIPTPAPTAAAAAGVIPRDVPWTRKPPG